MNTFIHTNRRIAPFRSLSINSIWFILCILAIPCSPALAQGDLLISPIRIVFEGSKRSQEINLANVGKDTASYTISMLDYRMKEDGGFEEITVPPTPKAKILQDRSCAIFPVR